MIIPTHMFVFNRRTVFYVETYRRELNFHILNSLTISGYNTDERKIMENNNYKI